VKISIANSLAADLNSDKMYIPRIYKNVNEEEIQRFLIENSFGILVSASCGEILATHIPLELEQNKKEEWVLQGHVARGNPHWKHFEDDTEVLAIFNGPHTYISSSWYDHVNVPTWNYIAVHVSGTIKILEGDDLYLHLKKLVDKYEQSSSNPVSLETMPEEFVKKEIRGIVGFEIKIESIEAVKKMSQNRNEKDYNNITSKLEERSDTQSKAVSEEMKRIIRKKE